MRPSLSSDLLELGLSLLPVKLSSVIPSETIKYVSIIASSFSGFVWLFVCSFNRIKIASIPLNRCLYGRVLSFKFRIEKKKRFAHKADEEAVIHSDEFQELPRH